MKHLLRVGLVWATFVSSATASSPAIRGMKPVGRASAGPRSWSRSPASGWPTPRSALLSAGDHRHEARGGQGRRGGRDLQDRRPTPRSACTTSGSAPPPASARCRTFSVGRPQGRRAEVEPNNDFAKPQPIPMNVTVNGVADNEDVDYYAVEAKKGERITAEVEGIRLGLTLFDPYVAILDAKRFELASSDDAALIWQDGFVSRRRPEDGTYIIQVRESAYARQRATASIGSTSATSRGRRPRSRPAARSARRVAVRWIGDVLGETDHEPDLAGRRRPRLRPGRPGRAAGPPPTRTSSGSARSATRSRPSRTTTPRRPPRSTPPVALNGVIGTPGDVDHYVFKAKKGRTYDVRVFARRIRSPLDSVLYVAAGTAARPSPATTTTAARQLHPVHAPRRTASTSSADATTSRRAAPITSTGSRSARSSRS